MPKGKRRGKAKAPPILSDDDDPLSDRPGQSDDDREMDTARTMYSDDAGDELMQLRAENRRLREMVSDKDSQLAELSEALLTMEEAKGNSVEKESGGGGNVKGLMKKNRRLNLALEHEKRTVSNLRNEVESIKLKLALNSKNATPLEEGKHSDAICPHKSRLDQAARTHMTLRSQLDITKGDLKRTRATLKREIGTDINIDDILNEKKSTSWKGRAEQITLLQSRVRNLRHKLSNLSDQNRDENSTGSRPSSATRSGKNSARPNGPSAFLARQENYVNSLSTYSKQVAETEKFYEAAATMERETEKWRRLAKAHKARVSILEQQSEKWRARVQLLLDSKRCDDELVNALRTEMDRLHAASSDIKRQASGTSKQSSRMVQEMELKMIAAEERADDLEEKLETLQSSRRAEYKSAVEDFDRELMMHKMQLVSMSAHTKSEEAAKLQKELEEALARITDIERHNSDLSRELKTLSARSSKAKQGKPPPSAKFKALEAEVKALRASTTSMQAATDRQLRAKEDQVQSLEAQVKHHNDHFQRTISAMRQQLSVISESFR